MVKNIDNIFNKKPNIYLRTKQRDLVRSFIKELKNRYWKYI